jgi:AAA domain/LysM domain
LGLKHKEAGRLQKIQALNRFLMDQLGRGGTVVLLMDEAQNLGEEVLENLCLLSNLETTTEKLLQVVLVGQPELETKLCQPGLRQLKQRIAIRCQLERLDDKEVGPFIQYRLDAVGYKRYQLFTPEAVQEIAYCSKGVPRLINILCDNALLIAYATSKKRITTDIVREAAADLRLESQRNYPIIAENSRQSTRELTRRTNHSGTHSGRTSYRSKLPAGSRRGLRFGITICFLGVGGMGLYAWQINTSLLDDLGRRVGSLHHTLHGTIERWTGDLGSRESLPDGYPKRTGEGQSTLLIKKVNPASATDLLSVAPRKEGRDNHLVSEQTKAGDGGNPSFLGGKGNDGEGGVASIAEIASWRRKPMVVQPGSSVAEIAASAYGAQRNLGLDLIKEYNTHIENLNRILAGQKLWLPPLSLETLVRQQPDGSYNLILASFRSPRQSEQLAQTIRLREYNVVVTPRRLSDNLMLHRVEISALENADTVNQAWEIASTNQWIASAEDRSGNRF